MVRILPFLSLIRVITHQAVIGLESGRQGNASWCHQRINHAFKFLQTLANCVQQMSMTLHEPNRPASPPAFVLPVVVAVCCMNTCFVVPWKGH